MVGLTLEIQQQVVATQVLRLIYGGKILYKIGRTKKQNRTQRKTLISRLEFCHGGTKQISNLWNLTRR